MEGFHASYKVSKEKVRFMFLMQRVVVVKKQKKDRFVICGTSGTVL